MEKNSPIPSAGPVPEREARDRNLVLSYSTVGFTVMFAVWLMFGVLGIPIRRECFAPGIFGTRCRA